MDSQSQKPKKKSKKKVVIIIVAALVLLALFGNFGIPAILKLQENQKPKGPAFTTVSGDEAPKDKILTKTVMIYLDGADLEEKAANCTRSIKEIIESGFDTKSNNILLYTGGSDVWLDYDIPTDKDCIYIIKDGTIQLLEEYPAQNVGESKTLETFMKYCVSNYPAEQYGLILSDHGGGPNIGVCSDYRNNHDILSLAELQAAFKGCGFCPEAKMEFIFFDACLMASVEVAYSMKDYAHYMVASENVSYTNGSDYSFMKALNEYNSGADIGKAYIDAFYDPSVKVFNIATAHNGNICDVTYSCIKLSEIGKVKDSVNNLFKAVNKSSDMENALAGYAHLAKSVKEFSDSYSEATGANYDLIDLKDWMTWGYLVDAELADDVVSAVDNAVVYNRSNTERMHGLTIYYPKNICSLSQNKYSRLDFSEEYSNHVEKCFVAAKSATNALPWETLSASAQSDETSSTFSAFLTDEQAEKLGSAKYYVLAKYSGLDHSFEEDEYILVTYGNDYDLSENVLTAAFDYRAPVVYNKNGESVPFCSPVYKANIGNGETVYTTYAGLQYVPDIEDFPGENDPDGVNALAWQIENMRLDTAWLTMEKKGDSLDILYGELSGENGLPSRMMVDPLEYQTAEFTNPLRRVKYDSEGNILPVDQWTVDISIALVVSENVGDISVKLESLSGEVEYYGVIVLKDIYGNEYSTEILPLN